MGTSGRWLAPSLGALYLISCLVTWNVLLHRHLSTDPTKGETSCLYNVLASFKLDHRRTSTEDEPHEEADGTANDNVTAEDTRDGLYAKYAAIKKSHLTIESRKIRGACHHQPKGNTTYSSVEFTACCGLGHRLARMSAAAHVAQRLQAGLHSFWKCCDTVDVFEHLFGKAPFMLPDDGDGELALNRTNEQDPVYHVQFRNRIPGYYQISRNGREDACPCTESKTQGDYLFYTQIMERYRYRDRVQAFINEHFQGKTSIGIHIRAGNGETGDFTDKNRDIKNEDGFVQFISNHVRQLAANFEASPILFIATDTPSFVEAFRKELLSEMPVVDMPQIRPAEGEGVLFGGPGDVTQEGEECLLGWEAAIEDMMILSSTDVVVATKASSFVQTMPLSVVLGRQEDRKVKAAYCEIVRRDLACYESALEWCCKGRSSTAFEDTFFDMIPDWTPGQ